MLSPVTQKNTKNLDSYGISPGEIDTSSRMIESASPEKPVLIKIYTDSEMNLRIRLLETPPKAKPKLFNETMHISRYICGSLGLYLTLNHTLTRQTNNDTITVADAFIHQSRVFYINSYFDSLFEIFSDDGKFFTSLPPYFTHHFKWHQGEFISNDTKLVFVPYNLYEPFNAVLISEDFFRYSEIIPGNEHLANYMKPIPYLDPFRGWLNLCRDFNRFWILKSLRWPNLYQINAYEILTVQFMFKSVAFWE